MRELSGGGPDRASRTWLSLGCQLDGNTVAETQVMGEIEFGRIAFNASSSVLAPLQQAGLQH